MNLIIDRKNMHLLLETKGCLRVQLEGKLVQRVPIAQLSNVIVHTNTQVESKLLQALVQAGVPFVALPNRSQPRVALVQGNAKGSIQTRIKQFEHYFNKQEKVKIVSALLIRKFNLDSAFTHFKSEAGNKNNIVA